MNHKSVWMSAALLLASAGASAGYLVCNGQLVSNKVNTCPDGSIPKYVPESTTPNPAPYSPLPQPQPVPPTQQTQQIYPPYSPPVQQSIQNVQPLPPAYQQRDVSLFLGVWRTNIAGAVWASPTGYQGSNWAYMTAGVALGDLIIKPDGTYVWMWPSRKNGRWEVQPSTAPYPLLLIDEDENRRWHLGWSNSYSGQQLYITDGGPRIHIGRR